MNTPELCIEMIAKYTSQHLYVWRACSFQGQWVRVMVLDESQPDTSGEPGTNFHEEESKFLTKTK